VSQLKAFVAVNQHGIETIDFSNPDGFTLNRALLGYIFKKWDIPKTTCAHLFLVVDYIGSLSCRFAASSNKWHCALAIQY
jgi:23S rRNA (adenine1618-N6)-methyltransferase